MFHLRLGLRLGPFVVMSDARRRPRVPWTWRDWMFAAALAFAIPTGMLLILWWVQ